MNLEIVVTIVIFFVIFSFIAKNLINFEKTLELKKRQKGEIKNRSITRPEFQGYFVKRE